MKPTALSALILGATLVIGMVLGSLVTGAVAHQRRARVEQLREPGGFIEHMERVIAPRDDEQRRAVRPILEAAARRNEAIIDSTNALLRTRVQEMLAELEPLLSAEQYRRVRDAGHLPDPFRPPPPPGAPAPQGDRRPPPR